MMTTLSLTREGEEDEEEKKKPLVEREHMFDKVVTPSDVGKLNRLVIPKQHAERYFPLDSSSNEKGLLLNFEDLTGKSWRFRYSYWNSSQSYVMTKGWSRFVKDKKLNAGDIVSFQRSVGDSGRESRLFIDWRRRPKVPDHQVSHFAAGAMFPRFYSFPTTTSPSYNLYDHQQLRHHHHQSGYNNFPQFQREFGYGYFVRSLDQRVADPLVIESVPVMIHGGAQPQSVVGASGKRLRLFGVDMECGESEVTNCTEEESSSSGGSLTRGGGDGFSSSSLFHLRLGNNTEDDHFTKKGKSSLSFDLDQ